MDELKPCQFCGYSGNVIFNSRSGRVPCCDNDEYFLNLNSVGFQTEEEAIEARNRTDARRNAL